MRYLGSKRRIAKDIIPIILDGITEDQYYIEPFVGGCNMMDKVTHKKKIGYDNNFHLINMWVALQDGWLPPEELSKEKYLNIKNNKSEYADRLVGFTGFGCSFGGKWFGGYASGGHRANGEERNYCSESRRAVLKQIKKMGDVQFYCADYRLIKPENAVIYCDPPYANTTKYKNDFDHAEFWGWCRKQSRNGNKVFVSEYNAPDDFECVWEKETTTMVDIKQHDIRTERLFKV